MAASTANSTARLLRTGSEPGMPRQTGQTWVFGGAPNRVAQEQKIFVSVSNWTCTSSPIPGSYFEPAATLESGVVTISRDYRSPCTSLLLSGNFEVEQFASLGIVQASQVQTCSRHRGRDSRNIEEHETGLC